jgi:hypothetical protein
MNDKHNDDASSKDASKDEDVINANKIYVGSSPHHGFSNMESVVIAENNDDSCAIEQSLKVVDEKIKYFLMNDNYDIDFDVDYSRFIHYYDDSNLDTVDDIFESIDTRWMTAAITWLMSEYGDSSLGETRSSGMSVREIKADRVALISEAISKFMDEDDTTEVTSRRMCLKFQSLKF